MFWSLTVKPGETVSQTCFMDLAVSNATLGDGNKKGEKVFLKVQYPISMTDDGEMVYEEAVLCALTTGGQENALINAHFDEDDEVRFSVTGKAPVYLTGNFIEPDFDGEEEDDEDDMMTEEEFNSLSPEDRARFEKMMAEEEESDEEESDEEESDEEESSDEEAVKAAAAKIGSKRALENAKTPDAKRTKTEKKTPAKEAKAPAKEAKAPAKEAKTPAKKEKAKDAKTPAKDAKTPKKEEAKTPAKDAKKEPKTPQKEKTVKRPDTPTVKTVSGGLQMVDLQTGSGKEAKNGATVTVQYIGRLATGSKKVFDKSKKFSFRLGAGEVIKGWDIGVAGMKVGGKRKLLIPAKLAYGASGAPPDIPPNAKLEFDVILSKC